MSKTVKPARDVLSFYREGDTIPCKGELREGEAFPPQDQACITVMCIGCGEKGLGIPGSLVRCPFCETRNVVPKMGLVP